MIVYVLKCSFICVLSFFRLSQLNYKPGEADTEFAKRFKHLVGAKVKTVGEAFAEFTNELGFTVNPLYKNMVTDLVGTTHLILVDARFERDEVWSLGIITALDLLLKNYPEKDVAEKIVSSLFKSVGLDEAKIRKEAADMQSWASSASREEVEAALQGEGSSTLASIAKNIKGDQFWMYSRYFGIGLVKIMENLGIEMDKDEVYPIMEDWMSKKLGRSHLSACVRELLKDNSSFFVLPKNLTISKCSHCCFYYILMICFIYLQSDSDLFFKIREKLDMMETMMKEIEIREKKRMAERLEEKAEQALKAAEREDKFTAEIEAEAAKNREKVDA